MKDILRQIHKTLIKNKRTVAVAESCSGGLVSKLLTELGGSSRYFVLGVVAYSNQAKQKILKVPAQTIKKNGAVSAVVAAKMAQAVRKTANTDFSIGITGIAGPGGGSPKKKVGTVFIAVRSPDKNICRKFHFQGNRNSIRNQAAVKSLELLQTLL
jgi:PncC family amidohydrolase